MVGQISTYQALLTKPASLAQVEAQRKAITKVGGRVHLHPGNAVGQTSVVLELPAPYQPDDFLPGLPFFPIP